MRLSPLDTACRREISVERGPPRLTEHLHPGIEPNEVVAEIMMTLLMATFPGGSGGGAEGVSKAA